MRPTSNGRDCITVGSKEPASLTQAENAMFDGVTRCQEHLRERTRTDETEPARHPPPEVVQVSAGRDGAVRPPSTISGTGSPARRRRALSPRPYTRWRRLTEVRAGAAKSVFHFDVQGPLAKSSHAWLPWLPHLRLTVRRLVYFWPFYAWCISWGVSV